MVNIPPSLAREIEACEAICGSDEAGTGAWAGPYFVCATVVPKDWNLPGVTDSKKLSPSAREKIFPDLVSSLTYCLVRVEAQEVDRRGLGSTLPEAHLKAIQGALAAFVEQGNTVKPLSIVDGSLTVPGAFSLPKADLLIPAVSAASIIAKVSRDRYMRELHRLYPQYGFDEHSGYGTKRHQDTLKSYGLCPEHRRSYRPLSAYSEAGASIFDLMEGLE